MEEWKQYRLGDIISISSGLAYKGEHLGKGDSFLLGMGCVSYTEQFLEKGMRKYDGAYDERYSLKAGDIVLATRQQSDNLPILGMPAIIPQKFHNQKMVFGTNLYKVNLNSPDFSNSFLYWLLKTPNYIHHIKSCQTGTTVRMITKANIEDYTFFCPEKSEREKICKFLWNIENKIALNRRINDNLEQQAQALFKSWFVDFEPFKDGKFVESEMGMIPEGWKVGTIGEYCSIRSGYAFKSSWWQETGTKVIKIKNITDNKTLDMSDCSYVSSDKTYKAIDFQASPGDLIIAMTGATIGKFCIIPFHNDNIYINQRVGKFFLGNNPLDRLPFIYCCLSYEPIYNEIISKGQGSAQPNLGGADIENIRIVLSPSTELKEFNSLLRPIFQKKMQIEYELSKLSVLRDTLLPRLMSGELKINDLNC